MQIPRSGTLVAELKMATRYRQDDTCRVAHARYVTFGSFRRCTPPQHDKRMNLFF